MAFALDLAEKELETAQGKQANSEDGQASKHRCQMDHLGSSQYQPMKAMAAQQQLGVSQGAGSH